MSSDPFVDGRCLSNFEALEVLRDIEEDNPTQFSSDRQTHLFKSKTYAENFKQFTNKRGLDAARNVVSMYDLTSEDSAAILNLCPRTVEDARKYIPSLSKLTNEQVEDMISQIQKFIEQ